MRGLHSLLLLSLAPQFFGIQSGGPVGVSKGAQRDTPLHSRARCANERVATGPQLSPQWLSGAEAEHMSPPRPCPGPEGLPAGYPSLISLSQPSLQAVRINICV